MHALKKHFQRIVVISLPHRADRREKLMANLSAYGLATEEDITWFDAVDGKKATIPRWWKSGPGAWGCRHSQLCVIEQARQDQLENVLIIEDDAIFHSRAAQWLNDVMPLLPNDWGQFFLGGQHAHEPEKTEHDKLVRGRCITRTHAYAIHHQVFDLLIEKISDDAEYKKHPGWHIDHQFGHCQFHRLWKAYAPSWWIAGQEEGKSNIAKASFDRRWWQLGNHYWKLPFIPISQGHAPSNDLLHHPDKYPKQDLEKSTAPTVGDIALWLRNTALAAWSNGRLPTFDPQLLSEDLVSRLWPAGIKHASSEQHIKNLADYPSNGLFPHPFSLT